MATSSKLVLLGLHVLEGRSWSERQRSSRWVGGAGGQAHAAAQAVIGRDLHPEGIGGILAQTLGGDSLEPGGQPDFFSSSVSSTGRMAAWGQHMEQRLHWMHLLPSHLGTLVATPRLENTEVPFSQVPSRTPYFWNTDTGSLIALLTVHGHDDVPDEGSERPWAPQRERPARRPRRRGFPPSQRR